MTMLPDEKIPEYAQAMEKIGELLEAYDGTATIFKTESDGWHIDFVHAVDPGHEWLPEVLEVFGETLPVAIAALDEEIDSYAPEDGDEGEQDEV